MPLDFDKLLQGANAAGVATARLAVAVRVVREWNALPDIARSDLGRRYPALVQWLDELADVHDAPEPWQLMRLVQKLGEPR